MSLLGTGAPPSNRTRGPATLLARGDERFLVDAGSGVDVRLVEAGGVGPFDWPRVFITHHHSDHVIDLGHASNHTRLRELSSYLGDSKGAHGLDQARSRREPYGGT